MAMGMNAAGAGGLLGGIIQGLEMGKQRGLDLQHKKDLLKLEQDKIKLLEKEHELNATVKGQEGLAKILEQLNKQNEVIKGGPGDVMLRGSDIKPGGFSVPMTPSQRGVGRAENKEPSVVQTARVIVDSAAQKGLKLDLGDVIFKLSQGGARSMSEQAELIFLPFRTFATPERNKQMDEIIEQFKEKGTGGGGGKDRGTGKEDWRKYVK